MYHVQNKPKNNLKFAKISNILAFSHFICILKFILSNLDWKLRSDLLNLNYYYVLIIILYCYCTFNCIFKFTYRFQNEMQLTDGHISGSNCVLYCGNNSLKNE